jgi:hypothetical protein
MNTSSHFCCIGGTDELLENYSHNMQSEIVSPTIIKYSPY